MSIFSRSDRPVDRFTPPDPKAASAAKYKFDLKIRPRRNRKAEWSRRLVRENALTTDDLIWPLFICEGAGTREPIASMPGIERLSVDEAGREAQRALKLKIPPLLLFPHTHPNKPDQPASDA